MDKEPTAALNVRILASLKSALDGYCAKNGRTIREVIEVQLTLFLGAIVPTKEVAEQQAQAVEQEKKDISLVDEMLNEVWPIYKGVKIKTDHSDGFVAIKQVGNRFKGHNLDPLEGSKKVIEVATDMIARGLVPVEQLEAFVEDLNELKKFKGVVQMFKDMRLEDQLWSMETTPNANAS